MTEQFYTPEEIAQMLKVRNYTVREWLRDGRLKGIHLGRRWRIRQSDLDAFITGAEKAPDAKGL